MKGQYFVVGHDRNLCPSSPLTQSLNTDPINAATALPPKLQPHETDFPAAKW
jgi:hypothetical protein